MEESRPKGPFTRTSNARPYRGIRPLYSPEPGQLRVESSPPKPQTELPTPQTEQSAKIPDAEYIKGVHYFSLIVKSKRLKNLGLVFGLLRHYSVKLRNRTQLFSSKLKRLFRSKQLELKMFSLRRLAAHAARNRVGYLRNKSVLEEKVKRVSFESFLHLLNGKFLGTTLHAFHTLLSNKRLFDRVRTLKRNSKLRFLTILLRVKLAEAWSKLRQESLNNLQNPSKALRCVARLMKCKTERIVTLGFEFIKKFSQFKKAQQVLKPQNRGVSEREQKLMDEVEQLTQESSSIKKHFEEETQNKENEKQNLALRLDELTQKNISIEQAIKELQQVKREPSPNLTIKDVYERVYHNFLYFLKYSDDEIPKAALIESLVTPMCRLDMPIDLIRQENEALQEVIDQYKRLNLKIPPQAVLEQPYLAKPYEHMLRENSELYCALATLIESSKIRQNDRDFVQLIEEFTRLQQQFVKVRIELNDK